MPHAPVCGSLDVRRCKGRTRSRAVSFAPYAIRRANPTWRAARLPRPRIGSTLDRRGSCCRFRHAARRSRSQLAVARTWPRSGAGPWSEASRSSRTFASRRAWSKAGARPAVSRALAVRPERASDGVCGARSLMAYSGSRPYSAARLSRACQATVGAVGRVALRGGRSRVLRARGGALTDYPYSLPVLARLHVERG